jgi:putative cardiolipin synthase
MPNAASCPATRPLSRRADCLRAAGLALLLALSCLAGGCAGLPPGANFPKTGSVALEHPEQTALGKHFADAALAHAAQVPAAAPTKQGSAVPVPAALVADARAPATPLPAAPASAPQDPATPAQPDSAAPVSETPPAAPALSALRLVPAGVDGFLLRAQLIDAAQKTLDLQYYIFRADETGKLLLGGILRAADRGVRVRLLVDDLDNLGQDTQIEALDAHPNIEVRLFNPLRYRGRNKVLRTAEILLWAPRLDYRMHNKLMVADNAVALVGGRNIGDEYFQVDPEGQQGDFETFAAGPVVRELSGSFDEFWGSPPAIPASALLQHEPGPQALAALRADLREHRQEKRADGSDYYTRIAGGEPLRSLMEGRLPLIWAGARVEYDSPEKKAVDRGEKPGRLLRHAIYKAARETQAEMRMISAYFIPGEDGMHLVEELRGRGVNVHLLTNSLAANNEPAAQSGYMHYRMRLLQGGVDLYEVRDRPGSVRGAAQPLWMSAQGHFGLHTKLYVFDTERIFIGSMNFDQRSLHINTELGLMIESPEVAGQGVRFFDALTAPVNSYHVTLEDTPGSVGSGPRLTWHTQEDGQDLALTREPAKSDWQRLRVNLLSLVHLDGEL